MPLIFKTMLALLGVVVAGLNPGASGVMQRANPNPLGLTPRNAWPFEPDFTPREQASAPHKLTTQDPPLVRVKTEAQMRKDEQFKLIKSIEAERTKSHHKEYYLDQVTFNTLNQRVVNAEHSRQQEEIRRTHLSFYLHVTAYLEVRQEINRLPVFKHSLLKKYEKIKQSIERDDTNSDLIKGIKRKFKKEITLEQMNMRFIGMTIDPHSYSKILISLGGKNPQYNHVDFLNLIREIQQRLFQHDYERLSYVIGKIYELKFHQQPGDEAIIAAQFAALIIKKETDFSSEHYHFDDIMAIRFTQEQFNVAADKSGLSLEDLLSVMVIEMPDPLKNNYIHYLTDTLIKKFLQENPNYTARELGEKLNAYFKSQPPELDSVYRACVATFIKRFDDPWSQTTAYLLKSIHALSGYVDTRLFAAISTIILTGYVYKRYTQVKAELPNENERLSIDKVTMNNISEFMVTSTDRVLPTQTSLAPALSIQPIVQTSTLSEGTTTTQDKKEDTKTTQAASPEVKENPLEKMKNEFLTLVKVEHGYARKNYGENYKKIYDLQLKNYEKSTLSWLSQPNVTKLGEFIRQLMLEYKKAGINHDADNNAIIKKLTDKYEIEREKHHAVLAAMQASGSSSHKKQEVTPDQESEDYGTPRMQDSVMSGLIADAYFNQSAYAFEEDLGPSTQSTATHVPQSDTSVVPFTLQPALKQFQDQSKSTPVTPYLNAYDNYTAPLAFRHAYKLLIIKFYSAWSDKLQGSNAYDYFRTLRNSLAHDNFIMTDDFHVKLFAVLICIENIQREDSPKVQDLNELAKALHETLKVPSRKDKSAINLQAKYETLIAEINFLYQNYTHADNQLIYSLALIDVFAEMGELLNQPDMKHLITQAPHQYIKRAFKAIIDFRNTEYHAGEITLKNQVAQVQSDYIILVDYLNKLQLAPKTRGIGLANAF